MSGQESHDFSRGRDVKKRKPKRAGHGWVIPAEGRARCGGPATCVVCAAEQADLDERGLVVVFLSAVIPGMVLDSGQTVTSVSTKAGTVLVGFDDGTAWYADDFPFVLVRTVKASRLVAPADLTAPLLAAVHEARAAQVANERDDQERTVAAIVAARRAGASLAAIGHVVGLTRERVRQIVNEREGAL